MATDLWAAAEAAIAQIGDHWRADSVESEWLEFKETPPVARSDSASYRHFMSVLVETAVCLANGPGPAVIVVGVKDHAPTRADAIVGVDQHVWDPDVIVREVRASTRPAIALRARAYEVDGRTLLLLGVPQGREVYRTLDGRIKVRLGDQCLPLTGEHLRWLQEQRQFDS